MEKLLLIDGHSIIHRAFYGLPVLSNSKGLYTNAVYGFLNILFRIVEEEKPDYLTVVFDVHAPTFRHKMYEAYKGTRKPMPEELRPQIPLLKQVLDAMGIMRVEKEGFEADDILGTLAKRSEKNGMQVSLVSGDRDLLQIATNQIMIRIPKTKGQKTEIENYYAADVLDKYQVDPHTFIELKALMGDTADNIPGVPKIGEKTATDLLITYKSLDGIYEHLDEISKKSVRETLRDNRELADLSLKLATICTQADIEYDYEKARVCDFYTKQAYEIFKELEFKNMLNRFDKSAVQDFKVSVEVIDDFAKVEQFFDAAKKKNTTYGISLLGEKGFYDAVCLAGLGNHEAVCIKIQGFVTINYMADKLCELMEVCPVSIMGAKKLYDFLGLKDSLFFINTQDPKAALHCYDLLIAEYLLNPLVSEYEGAILASKYMGITVPTEKEKFGKDSVMQVYQKDETAAIEYMALESVICAGCYEKSVEELRKAGMYDLMTDMEMPLSYVLYDMEQEGIEIVPDELDTFSKSLDEKIASLEQSIHACAGEEFNINSPKQLGEILFGKMNLPGGKKTKTGYSTSADVLEKLAPEYSIVADILEYRGLTKLKSTYAEGLKPYIDDTNRIHSSFNQTITATGRISSTEPNLQNIPVRMELGRQIRKVFVPGKGYRFLDADYSQIELRLLAHMSGDLELIEAYKTDADIHRITASKVFHVPFDEVSDLQRRNAKAVNFGIVYGISSFGLSQDLSISKKEAAEYIEQYFLTYPGIKEFLDKLVKDAKEKGYSETLYGRKRPIPELNSSNFMQRSFGERVAMNAPIQGTAADIMKIAMIHVYESLKKNKCQSKLILQVHDELMIQMKNEEEELVTQILVSEMEHAADLAVKLVADAHIGDTWYDAKA